MLTKGWALLAGVVVVALVAGLVVVTTREDASDGRPRAQEAAGSGSEGTRLARPGVQAPSGTEPSFEVEEVERAARAASDAHLSTALYRVAQLGDGRLSPELGARVTGLPVSGTGSLTIVDGRVVVEAAVMDLAAVDAMVGAGAQILNVNGDYRVVTAAVSPPDLEAVASIASVAGLREVLGPLVDGKARSRAAGEVGVQACPGLTTTEGDQQLKAVDARSAFGIAGTGVTVGILSDTFDWTTSPKSEEQDIQSGDLPGEDNPCGHPTPVDNIHQVCQPATLSCSDEGRALAQTVHDLAPASDMAFATAGIGEFAFADQIRALWDPAVIPPGHPVEADVIADDITYLNEPMFQDGPVANAVRDATNAGITYLSSAGNSNVVSGGKELGSYEAATYRPMTCPSSLGLSGTCHDFDPGSAADGAYTIKVASGGGFLLNLQWSEPRDGVTTNLDAYAFEEVGGSNILRASSTNNNPGVTHLPFEFLSFTNLTATTKTMKIVVRRPTSNMTPGPRVKWIVHGAFGLSGFEYTTSNGQNIFGPTVFGHNGSAEAISVAAVPFNNAGTTETFSSRGPVTHYFEPVPSTNPVPAVTISAPDIAATDGGKTTFFPASDPQHRFFGTSASVAHAAGVAALLKEADPSLDPAGMLSVLQGTAVPVGASTPNQAGAGLLDALAAVQSRLGSITIQVDATPDDELDFVYTSDAAGAEAFSLDDDTDGTLPASKTVEVLPGSYTFTQALPITPWHLSELQCDNDDAGDTGTGAITVELAAGEHLTCTYTNTEHGSITIEQETLPDDDADFTYSSDIPGAETFTIDDDVVIDDEADPDPPEVEKSIELTDVAPGSYTVSDITAANGFGRQSIECDTEEVADVLLGTLEIALEPGEHVSCVYAHLVEPVDGTIKVVQDTKPDDDQDFDYTVTAPELEPPGNEPQLFTLDDDSDVIAPDLIDVTTDPLGASYEITQTPVEGWKLQAIDCGDDVVPDIDSGTVTIVAPPVETPAGFVCVFTNEKLSSLDVQQATDPVATSQAFGYHVTGGPDEIDEELTLDAAGTNITSVEALRPGTYTITQTPAAGWSMASIDCGAADVETDLETAFVIVELPQDPAVECVFTNDQHGSITIVEDSVTDSANPFTFNVAGGAVNQDVTLDDDGSFVTPPPTPTPNTGAVTDLPVGDYTVQRTSALPAGWSFVSVVCTPDAGAPITNGATVHIDPGENVTCTFVHTTRQPDARVSTSSSMSAALADGVYNTNGAGQTKTLNKARGGTADYYVKFQNEGALAGNFLIKGSASGGGFTVNYYWGSTKVTSSVIAGTFERSLAGGGDSHPAIRIEVKIGTTVNAGTTKSVLLTVTSQDDGKQDVVKASTKAT